MYDPKNDPSFARPFIDQREQRERHGVRFTWIHGGFEGTSVKFGFSFPEKAAYQGRFYQFLSPAPGPDEEIASQSSNRVGMEDQITFALTHGAYFVETNMGASNQFGNNPDPTLLYRSIAAAAEYSRQVAMELYGCPRPYGYVYGGSGGGYKTCGCIENTTAFDGAVPYVTAAPVALPNVMCVGAYAARVLRNRLDWLSDAAEPGSTHDMVSGLEGEELEAFKEACAWGSPLECWAINDGKDRGGGSFPIIGGIVRMSDPTYFSDFWTQEGYAGTDPSGSALRDRVQLSVTVRSVRLPGVVQREGIDDRNRAADAWAKAMAAYESDPLVELETLDLSGCAWPYELVLRFTSGAAAGQEVPVAKCDGNVVVVAPGMGNLVETVLSQVQPGDTAVLDNSDAIALGYYHRHQATEGYSCWDMHRNADGSFKYPQRQPLMWQGFAYQASGAMQTGDIQGKVLMVNCTADGGAATWMADWYRQQADRLHPGQFKLWCMEHCGHMDLAATDDDLRTPGYLGALYRALIELARWVETGEEPTLPTVYRMSGGLPVLPSTAAARGGVQPVLTLLANGEKRCEIAAGDTVHFELTIDHATAADFTQTVEWSFEGESFARGTDAASHRYAAPGTYFAAVRVTANRSDDPFTGVQNIDRVRVVVA